MSGYTVELEDSEAERLAALRLFNEFIEWTVLRGSRPDFIPYSPSIVEMLFPTQGEMFPRGGPVWWEDEYIPTPLPVK